MAVCGLTAPALVGIFTESPEVIAVGARVLRTLMPRVDRDKETRNIMEMTLGDVNNEAAQILSSAKQNIIVFDKNLKMLLEDFVKPHPEIIMNWHDLDRFAEGRLKQMSVEVYKKLYNFISLLQNFNISITEAE